MKKCQLVKKLPPWKLKASEAVYCHRITHECYYFIVYSSILLLVLITSCRCTTYTSSNSYSYELFLYYDIHVRYILDDSTIYDYE